MMKQTAWQKLDIFSRKTMPFGLAMALILVEVAPTRVPGLAQIMPVFVMTAVYHWAVYRPEVLPALAVFFLGLMHDLLSGGIPGLFALILTVTYGLVASQRRFLYGKSFAVVWLGFAIVAAGAILLSWVMVSTYHVKLLDGRSFLFQYLATLGLFPGLAWLCHRWDKMFLKEI